jgi:hypothetical protein
MSQYSPVLETAPTLSSPLLPVISLLPSWPSLSFVEDETVSETEERQPVNTDVSKVNASIARCSPMFSAASALPKSKPDPLVPNGNATRHAHSQQATPSAPPGIEAIRPAVRDKRQPYPNAASSRCISSFPLSSLKTDIAEQHISVSVAAEDRRKVSSPGARTAPTPSRPSPAHSTQAHSFSSLLGKDPKRHVKDVVKEETREEPPASREFVPRQLERSDEHSEPPQLARALSNEHPSPFEVGAMPHKRCHPYKAVSGLDMTSSRYLHVFNEAASQQPLYNRTEECPFEHSEVLHELNSRAQGAAPPATTVDARPDTAGNVSSQADGSLILQHIPYSLGVPMLLDPELRAMLWVCPAKSVRLPDMLYEVDALSKCPAAGHKSSPQAGLETGVKQSPKPQLINSIVALRRARLAACTACKEFGSRLPKYPPDKLPRMDSQYSSNIVNKTLGMSTFYLPLPKTALSPPKTLPATLSRALILRPEFNGYNQIPCPGFKGHKPTLFVEGEGRPNGSVVNKIITTEIWHSPKLEQAIAPLVSKPEGSSWAPLHTPCLPSEPLDTTEPKQHSEHTDAIGAGTEPVLWTRPMLFNAAVVERCSEAVGIVGTTNGTLMDSHLVPGPSPAHHHRSSDYKPDRRLLWKPPDMEELHAHPIDVVRSRNGGMSRVDSPGFKTALTPFKPFHDLHPPLSGLKPDRKIHWKPLEWKKMGQCLVYVVRLRNNGMSRLYSPRLDGPHAVCFLLNLRPPHEPWDTTPVRQHADGIEAISIVHGSRS